MLYKINKTKSKTIFNFTLNSLIYLKMSIKRKPITASLFIAILVFILTICILYNAYLM